ncbi:hypothetical protein DS901_10195 [Loktanella sp. D2R18]|uniref:hypothetical protein n=1 Tax=Rhodobacterales TaxID=204455 RepID=UPI000DEBEB65|nr:MULTISPECIES: hypothetical protein [Rhodobacterales]MDO6591363.1 hypothetical protein [Yoonia sp. 1_MG-2023]RBW43564.1 hypothetical protein DS901_10195 [Loktanella sp. D2R18]
MMKPLMIFSALALATPAAAQQSFAAPEGCEAKLTVQQKGCVMVNVWTCEADNPGDQWIALIGQGGVFSVQRVDSEFQWMETYSVMGDEVLQQPVADPSSLTELFEYDVDTWDFTIETQDGPERNVGFDMLIGESVVIDGETLLVTEFHGQTSDADGNVLDASGGRQFVSKEHRLFFFGQSWLEDDLDQVSDMSPLEFIYPGEPGFFADQPIYECNEIETSYQP